MPNSAKKRSTYNIGGPSPVIDHLYEIFRRYPQVVTDSRADVRGAIFFALKGASFDGNRFAAQALLDGAVCAVVDDPTVVTCEKMVLVEDVLTALQQLAAHHRRVLGIPVLAITGSNGKTTTKELTARVLSRKFRVAVTLGNFNNHIGVPLTILSIDNSAQFGVVEMGASARGEIALLCSIAQPDYGLITNIGRAHLEGFGSEQGVVEAKGELFDYLNDTGGTAFVAGDDPIVSTMAAARPAMKSILYDMGYADGINSQLEGDYNRRNIAAAVAVGRYFEVEELQIADSLESYRPDNHRSQRVVTAGNELILDCYNANPSSMAAAITHFNEKPDGLPKGMILGGMLELGSYSEQEHDLVLANALKTDVERIWLVGREFCRAAQRVGDLSTGGRVSVYQEVESLIEELRSHPVEGMNILVKGSRGIALDKVVESL